MGKYGQNIFPILNVKQNLPLQLQIHIKLTRITGHKINKNKNSTND